MSSPKKGTIKLPRLRTKDELLKVGHTQNAQNIEYSQYQQLSSKQLRPVVAGDRGTVAYSRSSSSL